VPKSVLVAVELDDKCKTI